MGSTTVCPVTKQSFKESLRNYNKSKYFQIRYYFSPLYPSEFVPKSSQKRMVQMSNSAASDLEKCSARETAARDVIFYCQISSCFFRFLQTTKHYLGILESSE